MISALLRYEKNVNLDRRFKFTLDFINESEGNPKKLLDFGTPNDLSAFIRNNGFDVDQTGETDLDEHPEVAAAEAYDAITAFEILEHLLDPYSLMKSVKAKRAFISIPMPLWFAPAYKGNHEWDWHFHEFEDWQLDWMLQKAGWKVIRRKKWRNLGFRPGIRPILRWFTDRYYLVEAVRE